ncbi:MAG: YggT family protein [Betaproteobacteria bacterium]|nr:YggT family protein [Betaproteobacteria bacterium]
MNALFYLIEAAINFFTLLLLARFFLQLNRVPFNNQAGQFVSRLTDWLVKPMRRLVPGLFGLDLATLLPAWWLQCLLLLFIISLTNLTPAGVEAAQMAFFVLWRGALATLRLAIWFFIGALFLQAILSWVNPHSPLSRPLAQLTQPILRPLQRFVPTVANIDLSPLLAIVILQALLLLL